MFHQGWGVELEGFQLDPFNDLLFVYLVSCLFFAFIIWYAFGYKTLGYESLWVESNLMRMEYIVGQRCDEALLLGNTSQKM